MTAGIPVSPKRGWFNAATAARGSRSRLDAAWSRLADSRPIAYAFFALLYIFPNLVLAHEKLLWNDELYTLYLSKTAGWSDLWRALSTGADQHPPSFYYLTHLLFKLIGTTHNTVRLPALIGFGLSCVGMYEIARRVIGRRWALPAMLLPLTTPALLYATEARGYGLELGFVTLSLWMWILASEGVKRALTIPALAVGLCLSVASHYYAVFILIPLAVGELVRTRMRRSLDLPVWCALLAALIPLLLFAPIILKARNYSAHFWAVPHWSGLVTWYPTMLGYTLLLFLATAGLTFILRMPPRDDAQETETVCAPVVSVLATSAMLPMLGVIIAKLVTHAFTERYFIAALPATLLITLWGLKRAMRNGSAGPALISLFCIALFAHEWGHLHLQQVDILEQMRSTATQLRRSGSAPIIMVDSDFFERLSFYVRRDLAKRLVYVTDPHRSVRYLGHDTVDRGPLDLAPWFPVNVVWWYEWWRDHSFSLAYGGVNEWSWQTFALDEVGTPQLLDRDLSHLLISVTRTNVPEDDRTPSDPTGKPMLYDQLPADGPPLCKVYMPSEACPEVDDPSFKKPIVAYPDLR